MNSEFAEPLQQVDRVFVRTRGGRMLYFGGCDYFRLSSNPRILAAIGIGLAKYGLSTSASRKTTGNHATYERLETEVARYFGAESAVLVSSGYLTNLAVAQALANRVDRLFIDERSHVSLQDAVLLSRIPFTQFSHRNVADLTRRVQRSSGQKVAILTDGVFAFDGSLAPLREYREAAPEAILWIDDAHAAGVLGAKGRGSPEHAGISKRNLIQTVTFSKAFGVYGGAILCDRQTRHELVSRSSAVAGNTPLPLPLANACLTALNLATNGRRMKLRRNLREFGSEVPIVTALAAGAPTRAVGRLRRALEKAGIYPSFIRYPGGPESGFFRFAISSEHTLEQVRLLARMIRENS